MTSHTNSKRGFSLTEILVSISIGSVVLLGAAFMLDSTLRGYERVGSGVESEREARCMIARLEADLSTACFHRDGIFAASSARWSLDRLGFLTLQRARAQSDTGCIGDLCAVYYYIKDLSIGGKTIRCLMRGSRDSQDTFQALENNEVASLFSEREALDEPVVFGVISFSASPLSRDESGKWIPWLRNDLKGPEAIDMSLVIARRDLAGKLKVPDDWDGGGTTGWMLGNPSEANRHMNLDIYSPVLRFGCHEKP